MYVCLYKMDRKLVLSVAVVVVVAVLITSFPASSNLQSCLHSFENDTQDVFGLFNESAYVQLGLSHQIPCLADTDQANGTLYIVWYKLNKSADDGVTTNIQQRVHVATYKDGEPYFSDSKKYSLASNFDLIIHTVDESDGGEYLCEVHWENATRYTNEEVAINVQVIGDTLPGGSSQRSSTGSFNPGRRLTLPCECASQTSDVVYWSIGEGVTTDTQIIGARFSDGATLSIQHGADYSIGSDALLTVNSPDGIQDSNTLTFWCHVFQSERALRNCSTTISISDEKAHIVLKASPTKYYLPEGSRQILPCGSWMPGQEICGVKWIHEKREDLVLSYNLSANTIKANPGYDLATNFGLVIESVNNSHTGRYTCHIIYGPTKVPVEGAVDTRVIGDTFPASPSDNSSSTSVMQGHEITLPCECAQHSPNASVLAVYWSEGAGISSDTDVILANHTTRSLLYPESNGYHLSSNWSLTGILPNGSSRFWCHVFRSDDTLSNCLTNVQMELEESKGNKHTHAVAVVLAIAVALAIIVAVVRLCRWKRSLTCNELGEWPESDKLMYKSPELFINNENGCERLDVQSDVFTERNIILQGRSGSGKTSFLYKRRDRLQGMTRRFHLFQPKIVVLVTAAHIETAVKSIRMNISYRLHLSDVVILVDECNDGNDIDKVLAATDGLSRCQIVMATRNAKLAQETSTCSEYKVHNWCHVTITGFSNKNAQDYIFRKTKGDTNQQSPSSKSKHQDFFDKHTLFDSLAYLPGFLKRLCEYKDLDPYDSVSVVITGILKHMISTNYDLAESEEKRKEYLGKCGQLALSAMVDCASEMDFSLEDGNQVLQDGIEMGLFIRNGNIDPKQDPSRQEQHVENESRRLLHESKIRFSLEIFQDYCAGKQMAKNIEDWLPKINLNNIEQLAHAIVFACDSEESRNAVVQHLNDLFRKGREQTGSDSLEDEIRLQKLTELCLEVNIDGRCECDFSIESFHKQRLRILSISSHMLTMLQYFLKHTPELMKSVELCRIDENLTSAEFKQYVYPEIATAGQQKKSQESQNEKDLLKTLQSELKVAQSGDECHLSSPASWLVDCVSKQTNLETIVLLGTVIDAQQIRDLILKISNLEHLKRLDLRLNTETDDRAFERIPKLSRCTTVIDLRLSLYKVTKKGFQKVKAKMEKDSALLERLEILHLLHGYVAEGFDEFLTFIIKDMKNLQRLHITAQDQSGIPGSVVEEIKRRKPDLSLVIDEPLSEKGASTSTCTTSGQTSHEVKIEESIM